MRVGKLTSEQLNRLVLDKLKIKNDKVIMSAGLSEDCAAIRHDGILLITTDPITASGDNAGALAIEVSANDVAACGGKPFCCTLTLIAPPSITEDELERIVDSAAAKADMLNVDIVGGHTEVSDSVVRTVASVTMLGKADRVIGTAGCRPGDGIIITKQAGIEGTYIIANDYPDKLGLTEEERAEAASYGDMLSVLPESEVAVAHEISGMHDVTEGGVFGAVAEMCQAAGTGAVIYTDKIPFSPLTVKVCQTLGLDRYRLISSGSLIITSPRPEDIVDDMKNHGIKAAVIGKITEKDTVAVYPDGTRATFDVTADELLKAGKL